MRSFSTFNYRSFVFISDLSKDFETKFNRKIHIHFSSSIPFKKNYTCGPLSLLIFGPFHFGNNILISLLRYFFHLFCAHPLISFPEVLQQQLLITTIPPLNSAVLRDNILSLLSYYCSLKTSSLLLRHQSTPMPTSPPFITPFILKETQLVGLEHLHLWLLPNI